MNSYEACSRHINGHLPYCCQCQEESLRDLLRDVANLEVMGYSPNNDFCLVKMPGLLWVQILPLRAKEEATHGQKAQAASDQAPSSRGAADSREQERGQGPEETA